MPFIDVNIHLFRNYRCLKIFHIAALNHRQVWSHFRFRAYLKATSLYKLETAFNMESVNIRLVLNNSRTSACTCFCFILVTVLVWTDILCVCSMQILAQSLITSNCRLNTECLDFGWYPKVYSESNTEYWYKPPNRIPLQCLPDLTGLSSSSFMSICSLYAYRSILWLQLDCDWDCRNSHQPGLHLHCNICDIVVTNVHCAFLSSFSLSLMPENWMFPPIIATTI